MIERLTFDILGATLITIAVGMVLGILSPSTATHFTAMTPYTVLTSILLLKWGWRLMDERKVS